MANELEGMKVAILATHGVEQSELTEPKRALEETGAHRRNSKSNLGSTQNGATENSTRMSPWKARRPIRLMRCCCAVV